MTALSTKTRMGADERLDQASVARISLFRETRYFPGLDGLRAVSIFLVVALHSTDAIGRWLHGVLGVTIFFVISGFIITTLLLREEAARGRISIRAFYIRRAFRLLPLYYLALAAYIVLIGLLRLQSGAADLWRSLPYYLTYQNDFAPSGSGFGHTWSLAVEEKFYAVWPLLLLLAGVRRRLGIALALGLVTMTAGFAPGMAYLAVFAPIAAGCCVALILHHRADLLVIRWLTQTPVILAVTFTTAIVSAFEDDGHTHVAFGWLIALLIPAVVAGPRWTSHLLGTRLMAYVGRRSYAIYLIHRMAKGLVDRLVPPASSIVAVQAVHILAVFLVALLGAELLHRAIEGPLIDIGRRVSGRLSEIQERSGRPRLGVAA